MLFALSSMLGAPSFETPPASLSASTAKGWEEVIREIDTPPHGSRVAAEVCDWGPDRKVHIPGAAICTNARDESLIAEWVAHHLNIGFGHALLIDDRSATPISKVLKDELPPDLLKRTTVLRLCDNRLKGISKMEFQAMFVNAAPKLGANWAMHLDADEFLVLPRHDNVNNWLKKEIPADRMQVAVNWLRFGSNNLELFPEGKTMFEAYTRHANGAPLIATPPPLSPSGLSRLSHMCLLL